jgi:hypothetical protein
MAKKALAVIDVAPSKSTALRRCRAIAAKLRSRVGATSGGARARRVVIDAVFAALVIFEQGLA